MSAEEILQEDNRIHCVFYFFAAHTMKEIDLSFLSKLSGLVPIIPVVAKADTMTTDERNLYLSEVHNTIEEMSRSLGTPITYNFSKGRNEIDGISSIMGSTSPPRNTNAQNVKATRNDRHQNQNATMRVTSDSREISAQTSVDNSFEMEDSSDYEDSVTKSIELESTDYRQMSSQSTPLRDADMSARTDDEPSLYRRRGLSLPLSLLENSEFGDNTNPVPSLEKSVSSISPSRDEYASISFPLSKENTNQLSDRNSRLNNENHSTDDDSHLETIFDRETFVNIGRALSDPVIYSENQSSGSTEMEIFGYLTLSPSTSEDFEESAESQGIMMDSAVLIGLPYDADNDSINTSDSSAEMLLPGFDGGLSSSTGLSAHANPVPVPIEKLVCKIVSNKVCNHISDDKERAVCHLATKIVCEHIVSSESLASHSSIHSKEDQKQEEESSVPTRTIPTLRAASQDNADAKPFSVDPRGLHRYANVFAIANRKEGKSEGSVDSEREGSQPSPSDLSDVNRLQRLLFEGPHIPLLIEQTRSFSLKLFPIKPQLKYGTAHRELSGLTGTIMQITDSIRTFFLRLKTSKTLSCLWGSTFLPYISSLVMVPLALLKSITLGFLNTPRWAYKRYLPVFTLTLNSVERAWDTLLDHFNMLQEKEAVSMETAHSDSDALETDDAALDAGTAAKAKVVTFSSDSTVLSAGPTRTLAAVSSLNPRDKMYSASTVSDQKSLRDTFKVRSKGANQRVTIEKKPSSILLFLELSLIINLIVWPLVWTSRSHAVYEMFNRPSSESNPLRPSDVSLFMPEMVSESPNIDTALPGTYDATDILDFNIEDTLSGTAPAPVDAAAVPLAAALAAASAVVPMAAVASATASAAASAAAVPMAVADAAEPSSDSNDGDDKQNEEQASPSSSSSSIHLEDTQHAIEMSQCGDVLPSIDASTALLTGTGSGSEAGAGSGSPKREVLRFESRGVAEASRMPGIPKLVIPDISKLSTEESDVVLEAATSDGKEAAMVVADSIAGSFSLQHCIASCSEDLKITEDIQEDVDQLLACIENEVSMSGIKFNAIQPAQPFQSQIFDGNSRNFWHDYDIHSRVHYKYIKKAIKDFTNMIESFLPDLWIMLDSFRISCEDFFMKTLSFITCRDGSEYCYIHGGASKDAVGFQECDKRIY
jgi:Septin